MLPIQVDGQIDDQHPLLAQVPGTLSPGPVTVWVSPKVADEEAATELMAGIAQEWADELSDEREDIYTLDDD